MAEKRVDFNYNLASQFESIERYASVDTSAPVVASTFEYDGRGRLEEIEHESIVTHGYVYDQADRLTSYINSAYSAENVTYSYDDRGQLLGADYASLTDETYTYDDNGNRNNGGFTLGTNNRLTTDGTYTYAYDDEGNRTAKFIDDNSNSQLDAGDDDITEYEWDHRNRLTQVTERATYGGAATQVVDYVYDAFDRLISRTVDSDTEFLINDGRRVVLTLESDGDVIRRSLWADAVDMLLADEDALGETYFHLADHLGTTRDVVDDQGNLVNHLVFDSFGNILSETNSSAEHTRIYAGLIWEVTIDQYRSFTRFYDPATGKWTSEDPIGFAGGDPNLGRYVGNGPTGFVDPSGLIGAFPIGGMSGVQEAQDLITVYVNTEHLSWWQRAYVVGAIPFANMTGVRGVSDACSRHDAIDAHRQSGLERGIDGVTGGIQLVGTGLSGAGLLGIQPATTIAKTGGRLGSQSTRRHVIRVANELERRGFRIVRGGGRFPEEYIPGPGGARKGCAYPDITAVKNGRTVRVNTVDTLVDQTTLTSREARNAAKIRHLSPNDHLVTIPKPK
jgi:RHS repeat-associated protein